MNGMKKYIFIILAVVVIVVVGFLYHSYQSKGIDTDEEQGNTEEATEKDTREIVWEQLSAEQQKEIDGTWKDGKVSRVTLSENAVMNVTESTPYVDKDVYLISFPSKLNATIGDVIVYADVSTSDIIGYGLRD